MSIKALPKINTDNPEKLECICQGLTFITKIFIELAKHIHNNQLISFFDVCIII